MTPEISGIKPLELDPLTEAEALHNPTSQANTPGSKLPLIESKANTVALSLRAHALLLKRKGWTINEIAARLNLDTKTVREYTRDI